MPHLLPKSVILVHDHRPPSPTNTHPNNHSHHSNTTHSTTIHGVGVVEGVFYKNSSAKAVVGPLGVSLHSRRRVSLPQLGVEGQEECSSSSLSRYP